MTDDARQTSVLLIEDHRDIAEMIVEFLEGRGFAVDYAGDGVTGLHLAVTNPYDVIVLDVMLPGLDGLALCRAMAGTERNGATPVLLVTGDPEVLTQASAFVAGRRDRAVLAKPFNAARLVAALARLGAPP